MSTLRSLKHLLLIVLLAMTGFFPVQAASSTETNADTGKPFATVWRLRGDVFATPKNGKPRLLKEGATVNVGELVRATPDSEAVLKTPDGGIVAVRPGAEFVPERFAAEGKKTDRQVLRLITGSLRLITGWIGQLNKSEHRVETPSATIGIRGTDHEPYVLPAEMANSTYRQGTYDKVNRGATLLDANGGNVEIDSGKVGFARAPAPPGVRSRALMTLLLPVLLAKVPDFYVPGSFDQELDRYSETIDATSQKQLESRTGGSRQPAAVPNVTNAPGAEPPPVAIVGCPPQIIGEAWLGRFDRAVIRRDVKTILGLFAPEAVAKATVRSGKDMATLEFKRDELVDSTLKSIANLKDYQQRRVSLEAKLADGESEATCRQVEVKSIAIEQGTMNGRPYRFEALEEYLLEQRNGEWLAIKAQTTQR